jgi:hypothetical protein
MERNHSAPASGSVDFTALPRGRNVVLRPLRREDVERVAEIQAEPGVARWWGPPDEAELRRQAEGRDEAKALAIQWEGKLVGLIQYHEESEPDFRHAGIDLFLAGRTQGSGLRPDAVRTLARYLIHERGHHRLTSTRRPTTPRPSGRTKRSASARSASCASTGGRRRGHGATTC